jgi:putative ABC transport system substrate-binding protein
MVIHIQRREFIVTLGGAVAWPVTARAQQPTMPVIEFLSTRSRDESARVVSAFQRGLAETGYAGGQNVIIEYRWGLSQYDRLGALAGELVRRPVNKFAHSQTNKSRWDKTSLLKLSSLSRMPGC